MAQELPYLQSYKNVGELFQKAKAAKVPEAFTQKFLAETIGLKASGDRPLINLLRLLGFLDSSGKPTPRYSALKNEKIAGIEIARGIRQAYQPLFDANENAQKLDGADLKGLVAQVSGADTGTTSKIVGTFKSLLKLADFESENQLAEDDESQSNDKENSQIDIKSQVDSRASSGSKDMRPEFHYNFQIHLPSNGSEETYANIFNAIRKVFK
ncbi:DUF5343 domain-containing protein [Halopseudomonas bauzanensis]|uniref:DUF5343 domain-containing protein n=1 Tax=Halopseudomonas bauzanensis TaxID=653930 RepID=A0A031M7N4_9GAMM|nr:DUF5343 domain-containing protein [Halopseudomonas bauzanensis]EZQ16051.1 hypothetical protein CF98_07940 [Halopseudomonas bauzanensis]SES33433.1 hypothetical protein SAMN05216589_3263 [Halopseudomonas bauzanensis]SFM33840.1 hypothetical protein SAMN04487855_3259 [Halopseudomonas bauzanensis]